MKEHTSKPKRIWMAVVVAILCAACLLFFAGRFLFDSFTLLVYEEGIETPISSDGTFEKGRLVSAYSSEGCIDDLDGQGALLDSNFVFWFPATVTAKCDPEHVTYRSLQDSVGISLPNGSKGAELTVSGQDATSYMQMWVYISIAANEDERYSANPAGFESACIDKLQRPFLEVELQYPGGFTSKKHFSILPGYADEFGYLGSIIVVESAEIDALHHDTARQV